MSTLEIEAVPATIALADINIDPELQCRARGVNRTTVREYADAMRVHGIGSFPPVVVFRDPKGACWLADGFQRCAAAGLLGLEAVEMPADIREGSRKDALVFAAGANAGHGLRRTNADKRRAVELLLKACPKLSDRKLSEICGVGNKFVGDVRRQVCSEHTPEPTPEGEPQAPEASEPSEAVEATVARLSKALAKLVAAWPLERRADLQKLIDSTVGTPAT